MAHKPLIETGRYRVRLAEGAADLALAQALRAQVFRGPGAGPAADADRFDPLCRHVLVEDRASGALACCYRVLGLADGGTIAASYSAQFYDLAPLAAFRGPMAEVGRFCIAPEARDGDVLRLAWAALARIVDAEGIALLFGCSSFRGTDAAAYREAFALLGRQHLAPRRWRPGEKARDVVRFAPPGTPAGTPPGPPPEPDARRALKALPPLLRTYLAMGGWVSDHAVIDRDLGTLHVFTGLEIGAVPAARARALRTLAASAAAPPPDAHQSPAPNR